MKLFWIVAASALVFGCSHNKVPQTEPNTEMASAEDCNKVYGQILSIKVKEVSPDATADEVWASSILLDSNLREDGTTQRFFAHCVGYMNLAEVTCALQSDSIHGITMCEKLFKSPTKEHK